MYAFNENKNRSDNGDYYQSLYRSEDSTTHHSLSHTERSRNHHKRSHRSERSAKKSRRRSRSRSNGRSKRSHSNPRSLGRNRRRRRSEKKSQSPSTSLDRSHRRNRSYTRSTSRSNKLRSEHLHKNSRSRGRNRRRRRSETKSHSSSTSLDHRSHRRYHRRKRSYTRSTSRSNKLRSEHLHRNSRSRVRNRRRRRSETKSQSTSTSLDHRSHRRYHRRKRSYTRSTSRSNKLRSEHLHRNYQSRYTQPQHTHSPHNHKRHESKWSRRHDRHRGQHHHRAGSNGSGYNERYPTQRYRHRSDYEHFKVLNSSVPQAWSHGIGLGNADACENSMMQTSISSLHQNSVAPFPTQYFHEKAYTNSNIDDSHCSSSMFPKLQLERIQTPVSILRETSENYHETIPSFEVGNVSKSFDNASLNDFPIAVETTENNTEEFNDEIPIDIEGNAVYSKDSNDVIASKTTVFASSIKRKQLPKSKSSIKNINPEWHSLSKEMVCIICKIEYNSRHALIQHLINIHPYDEIIASRVAPHVAQLLRNSKVAHKCVRVRSKKKLVYTQFCYFCNEILSKEKHRWIAHMATHTGYFMYKCTDCSKKFLSSTIHGRKGSRCKVEMVSQLCRRRFDTQFKEGTVTGFLCDLCNYVRFDETDIENHLINEHDSGSMNNFRKVIFLSFPKPNNCPKAPRIRPPVNNLLDDSSIIIKNNNADWHCLNKNNICMICGRRASLVSHYVNAHPNSEVIPSRVAPKVADFLRSSKYAPKCEIIDRNGRLFFKQNCCFCMEQKCLRKYDWINHIIAHTGYYRHQCGICLAKFLRGSKHTCQAKNVKHKRKIINRIEQRQFEEFDLTFYLCNLCNFVRFNKTEMQNHLRNEHDESNNVQNDFREIIILSFADHRKEFEENHTNEVVISENEEDEDSENTFQA